MNLRKDNKKKKPMQLMLDEISGMMGVSQEMILSRMISRNISDSRMLFCYMAYEEGYLFREIASFLKISRCRATTAYYELDMSKKRTMQIDVIEEVKGTQFMQCKLYIDGNASVILMNKIDYERLKEEGIFIRDGKSQDSAGVLNTTNTFIEKN